MGKLGIHACAGGREWLQGRGSLQLAIDEHSTCSVGGFTSRFAALDDQNARTFLAELDRERKADNAATDYDHVPILHFCIVKERFLSYLAGTKILRAIPAELSTALLLS